jgi:membrane glycosyltransferase
MLPVGLSRPRGAIDPDQTLATAKICEAETVAEARAWLSPKERMALLHDRALLDRLVRLN